MRLSASLKRQPHSLESRPARQAAPARLTCTIGAWRSVASRATVNPDLCSNCTKQMNPCRATFAGMSDDLISGLLAKRTELTEEVQKLQTTIYHLDATLVAFGYKPGKTPTRRFANGELIRLIGEAERAGVATVASIARWVVKAKDWNGGGPHSPQARPVQRQGMPQTHVPARGLASQRPDRDSDQTGDDKGQSHPDGNCFNLLHVAHHAALTGWADFSGQEARRNISGSGKSVTNS